MPWDTACLMRYDRQSIHRINRQGEIGSPCLMPLLSRICNMIEYRLFSIYLTCGENILKVFNNMCVQFFMIKFPNFTIQFKPKYFIFPSPVNGGVMKEYSILISTRQPGYSGFKLPEHVFLLEQCKIFKVKFLLKSKKERVVFFSQGKLEYHKVS